MEEDPQPKGAAVVKDLLEAMGVKHYDAVVITQLLEFLYRYTSDLLETAQEHCTDTVHISHEDIVLAVQAQDATQFAQPPPQEVLLQLAEARNSKPLPKFKTRDGLRLPPEEDCLLGINMQLSQPQKGKADETLPDSAAASGQRSMRRGAYSANRVEIKLGAEASGAPPAPAQAPQSAPAAAQQPPVLAPPIAAFSEEDVEAEPVQGKPDVDMEEI